MIETKRSALRTYTDIYVCFNLRSAADGASSPNCDVDTLVWLHNKIDLANPKSLPTKGVVNINFKKDRQSSHRRRSKFSVGNFNYLI